MDRDPVIAVIVRSRDPATHLNYLYLPHPSSFSLSHTHSLSQPSLVGFTFVSANSTPLRSLDALLAVVSSRTVRLLFANSGVRTVDVYHRTDRDIDSFKLNSFLDRLAKQKLVKHFLLFCRRSQSPVDRFLEKNNEELWCIFIFFSYNLSIKFLLQFISGLRFLTNFIHSYRVTKNHFINNLINIFFTILIKSLSYLYRISYVGIIISWSFDFPSPRGYCSRVLSSTTQLFVATVRYGSSDVIETICLLDFFFEAA